MYIINKKIYSVFRRHVIKWKISNKKRCKYFIFSKFPISIFAFNFPMICSPMIPTKHHKKKNECFFFGQCFISHNALFVPLEQCIAENKHPLPSTLGNHLFCEHHVDDETLTTYIKQNTQQRRKERTKRGPKFKREREKKEKKEKKTLNGSQKGKRINYVLKLHCSPKKKHLVRK